MRNYNIAMLPLAPSRLLPVVAAILCGSLAVPFALLLQADMFLWIKGPERTVLPMLWTGALVGFVIGCLTLEKSATKSYFAETPTKAGFLCSFISAASLVVYSSLLHGRAGYVVYPALLTLFIAVVSILPSTLCAAFFGGIGTAVRSSLFGKSAGRTKLHLRPIHGIYLLCFLGLLSPLLPSILRGPVSEPPFASIIATTPPSDLEPSRQSPEPPPFKYERPPDFDAATPDRIVVVAQKRLFEIYAGGPVIISPDGNKLAFLRASSTPILVVMDLQSFKGLATLPLDAVPSTLAWSPDSEKLIGLFQSDDVRSLSVVFPEKGRVIQLPRPESSSLLAESLDWPDANYVVLHRRQEKPLCLDLESLDFRPLEETAFFRSLDTLAKVRFENPPTTVFPRSSAWSLEIAWTLHSLRQWNTGTRPPVQLTGGPGIFACSNTKPIRRRIPAISFRLEDRVIFAPDRSKVVVLAGSYATVFYLGLGPATKNTFRITTGKKLDELPNAALLKKALTEKHLCAFVSAPLINPLNDKTVGPDYFVKGVARVIAWDGTSADLLLEDVYLPVGSSDIVSTLFEWKDRSPVPLGDPKSPEWWTPVGDTVGAAEYQGSSRIEDSFASQGAQLEFNSVGGILSFRLAPTIAPSRPPVTPAEPPPAHQESRLPDTVGRDVSVFVKQHHQKSENGDINGIVADYADQVVHFDKGLVDRMYVRREEEKYHAPGYDIHESVRGRIRITPLSEDRVRAEYELQFLRVAPDTTWTKGLADVTLEIAVTPRGLQIVKQNSVPRDNERQKGRGNIPILTP